MVITGIGQILAIGVMSILGLWLSRVTRIDLTLTCLSVGFIVGLGLGEASFDTGLRADNIRDIVFFIILPVLIFEAAWHIQPVLLKRWLIPALLLATLGVLITGFITGLMIFIGIGHSSGFPWIAALLTGVIIAATDPVAVMGQLRANKAPKDLSTLFEGESLFNDASAIVLFSIVLGLALQASEPISTMDYLLEFLWVFGGGIVVGITTALISAFVLLSIGQSATSIYILIITAFGSFYLAEHVMHLSGIMAVMSTAIVMKLVLVEVESIVANGMTSTFEWLGQAFNSALFLIMGLVITLDMFQDQWLAMLIAIAASLIGRLVAVISCAFIVKRRVYNIPKGWQVLLIWGGLKGAIAIALVLSLPVELPYWWTIQSMVFGVVLFSILVQGTSNADLISKFSGAEKNEPRG